MANKTKNKKLINKKYYFKKTNNSMTSFKKKNKHSGLSKKRFSTKPGKTIKNSSYISSNFPAFFQKNFSLRSANVHQNMTPKLKTTHRSYYPIQDRLIVIGDIHGDLDKLIDCLKIARCINDNIELPVPDDRNDATMFKFFNDIEWTGGNTHIVQVGDQIDRIRPTNWDKNQVAIGATKGDEGSSLHIFYLLWYLNMIAKSVGGRVISLMGNHEFMNVDGDFRYVSPNEFKEYHNAFHKFYHGTIRPDEDDIKIINRVKEEHRNLENVPKGYIERRIAFNPSGIMANFFGINYKLVVQVGSWIFVHAGLTMNMCSNVNICKINNAISRYMITKNVDKKDKKIYNKSLSKDDAIYQRFINCRGDKSPVWCRDFGDEVEDPREEKVLNGKFQLLLEEYNRSNMSYHQKYGIPSAKYVAVGHTPQFHNGKGINSICDGKMWRCDVGMSRAFGSYEKDDTSRYPQVLEILNDNEINILM